MDPRSATQTTNVNHKATSMRLATNSYTGVFKESCKIHNYTSSGIYGAPKVTWGKLCQTHPEVHWTDLKEISQNSHVFFFSMSLRGLCTNSSRLKKAAQFCTFVLKLKGKISAVVEDLSRQAQAGSALVLYLYWGVRWRDLWFPQAAGDQRSPGEEASHPR